MQQRKSPRARARGLCCVSSSSLAPVGESEVGSPDSLPIGAAKPQEGFMPRAQPSRAYGTPIAKLSGPPAWVVPTLHELSGPPAPQPSRACRTPIAELSGPPAFQAVRSRLSARAKWVAPIACLSGRRSRKRVSCRAAALSCLRHPDSRAIGATRDSQAIGATRDMQQQKSPRARARGLCCVSSSSLAPVGESEAISISWLRPKRFYGCSSGRLSTPDSCRNRRSHGRRGSSGEQTYRRPSRAVYTAGARHRMPR